MDPDPDPGHSIKKKKNLLTSQQIYDHKSNNLQWKIENLWPTVKLQALIWSLLAARKIMSWKLNMKTMIIDIKWLNDHWHKEHHGIGHRGASWSFHCVRI